MSTMRILICVFSLFLFSTTHAQKWRPSKITLATSDTITGLARLDGDLIYLKQANEIRQLDNRKVRTAYIDDEVFISTHLANLKDAKGKVLYDSSFVKVLIDGDVRLYFKENKNNLQSPRTFIIQKKDSSALELVRKTIQVSNGAGSQNFQMNAYKTQLAKFLEDCPSLNRMLTKTDYYNEVEMTGMIRKYIECKGINTKFSQVAKFKKGDFTLLAGWDAAKIKFSSPFYYLSNSYTYSQTPFFGAQFSFPISRKGKLRLIGETLFKSTSIQMNTYDNVFFETSQTTIKVSYLHFNFGLKYSLPVSSHVAIDFLGAVSTGPVISKSFVRIINHSTQSNDFNFSRSESGILFGVGVNFNNHFGLTVRHDMIISNFAEYTQMSSSYSNFYYGLTYKFGKANIVKQKN